jgi:hypothetical protein
MTATHQSTSTPAEILDDRNMIYTVVTEAADYLGSPADIDHRYDTIRTLEADAVEGFVDHLTSDHRKTVVVFQGFLPSPMAIMQRVPVGYVYPDGVWHKVSQR